MATTTRGLKRARAVTHDDATTRIIARPAERPAVAVERVRDARAADDPRPPLPSPVDVRPRHLGWRSGGGLTARDARALIGAASAHTPTSRRNRALLALMYRSGLRPGEVVALATGDIDAVAGTVAVRAGRPWTRRTTGVDATTMALVASWLDARRGRGIAPAGVPAGASRALEAEAVQAVVARAWSLAEAV